jgi:cell division protein DivIC
LLKGLNQLSPARLILLGAAIIAVYFLASGAVTAIRAHQLRQEESRLRADIADLRERYERLEALKQYLQSDEYVEAVAREQLGLVRKGETGIVVISTAPPPADATGSEPPALWWDVLIR